VKIVNVVVIVVRENTMIKLKNILKGKKKINEENKFGLDYSDVDHWVVHDSLRDMNDGVNGIGASESADNYGWQDEKNYQGATKELNKEILKIVGPYYKAKQKFEKDATNAYKLKEKIFKKWRSKDGSSQYD
tara:strand:+ start:774 stop:1169 length:396 start_codon:yes stop_codon:yes gene_type:complete